MPRSRVRTAVSLPPPSRYWRAADAEAVINRLDESGLSVHSFARREGLNAQRLYRWRRALGRGEPPSPGFVELVSGATAPVEVVFQSGVVLRVPAGFDDETVRRLVSLLKGASRC